MQRQSHFKSAKILGGALFISAFLAGCGGDASTATYPVPTLAPPPVSNFSITSTNAVELGRVVNKTLDNFRNRDGGGLAPSILSIIVATTNSQFTQNKAAGTYSNFVVACPGGGNLTGTVTLGGNPRHIATGNTYDFVATDCITSIPDYPSPNSKFKFNGQISMTLGKLAIVLPTPDALIGFFTYTFSIPFGIESNVTLTNFKISTVVPGSIPDRTYSGKLRAAFSQIAQGNSFAVTFTNFDLGGDLLAVAEGANTQTITSFRITGQRNNISNTIPSSITALYNTSGNTAAVGDFAVGVQTVATGVPRTEAIPEPPTYIPTIFLDLTTGNTLDPNISRGGFKLITSNNTSMILTAVNSTSAKVQLNQTTEFDRYGNPLFEKTINFNW